MKKKTGFSISKTGQAVIFASILLTAFAVFLSQASPLFLNAAAASSNIRGTIVLSDLVVVNNYYKSAVVSLPGSSCNIAVNFCGATTSMDPKIFLNNNPTTVYPVVAGAKECFQTAAVPVPAGINSIVVNYYLISHLSAAFDCTP